LRHVDAHLMMPVVGASRRRATAGSPRAAIYLRISTEGQVDGTSIDTQRDQCRNLSRRHGFALAGEYVDAGVSGAASSRPALDELLAAAAAGAVDVIVVAKLDRLGRSLLQLFERLDALGVRVLAASEGIDTRTPAGRMMLQLLGVFAEFERERLRERSQDGHHRRALEGGFVGTTPPFGYRAVPNPAGAAGFVLAIDPTQAACILDMCRLLAHDRVPLTRVVKQLNAAGHRSDSGAPWTKQTLSRWARGGGPTAAGAWRWRELTVPIPPILTAAEHAAWMTWKRDTAKPALRHTTYLLGGRVRTPCGRYFHGRTAGTQNPVYVCRHRLQTPANSPDRCGCRSIRVETLDDAVWSQVRAALTSPTRSENRRPGGRRRSASDSDGGTTLDIGADTLAPRIADAAQDVADLQSWTR
jgi:site-specific DNA recombinase